MKVGHNPLKYQVVYDGVVLHPSTYFVLRENDLCALSALSGYIEALNILEQLAQSDAHTEQLRDDVAELRRKWENNALKIPD